MSIRRIFEEMWQVVNPESMSVPRAGELFTQGGQALAFAEVVGHWHDNAEFRNSGTRAFAKSRSTLIAGNAPDNRSKFVSAIRVRICLEPDAGPDAA